MSERAPQERGRERTRDGRGRENGRGPEAGERVQTAGGYVRTFFGDMQASASEMMLSPVRTLTLTLALTATIAAIILAIASAVGVLGATLVNSGFVSYERLTSAPMIVAVVFVGSVVIAMVMCIFIAYSFVNPLRRMTAAMTELARGNFDLRITKTARLSVREVDDFARSFNVAAQELGSTELMRADFISDFSHEFRTPINALCGFAQLLRDDELSAAERREYLDIIVQEAQRLAGLSERILALSKLEASAILSDVTRVDLAETLRRAAALEAGRAEDKGVALQMSLDECACDGNSDYLVQLWTNLLNNAVKFSEPGGRIDIALYGGRQGEAGRAGVRDEAVCWISDDGCGMDEQTREHLFDRFYQGDTSHASEGSGLGLALCRRIVELHGGTITASSTPGKGSVFEVRLPLSRTAGVMAGTGGPAGIAGGMNGPGGTTSQDGPGERGVVSPQAQGRTP